MGREEGRGRGEGQTDGEGARDARQQPGGCVAGGSEPGRGAVGPSASLRL